MPESASRGVYLVLGSVLSPGGVVPGPGGGYLVWGVYLVLGGLHLGGGHLVRHSPPCGQNDTRL